MAAHPTAPCPHSSTEAWTQPISRPQLPFGQYGFPQFGVGQLEQTNFHSSQAMLKPRRTCLYLTMPFKKEDIDRTQLCEFLASTVENITTKQLINFITKLGITSSAQLECVLQGTFCSKIKECQNKGQYKLILTNAISVWENTPSLSVEQLDCALNCIAGTATPKPYYFVSPFISLPGSRTEQTSNLLDQIEHLSTDNKRLADESWQWDGLTKRKDAEILALQTELSQLKQQLHEFHTGKLPQTQAPMPTTINGATTELTQDMAKVAITSSQVGVSPSSVTVKTGDTYKAHNITIVQGDNHVTMETLPPPPEPIKPKYTQPELEALNSKPRVDIIKEILSLSGDRVIGYSVFRWSTKGYKKVAEKLGISDFEPKADLDKYSACDYFFQNDKSELAQLCWRRRGFTYRKLLIATAEIAGDFLTMDELTHKLLDILKRHELVAFDDSKMGW
ncbi:hypothetical protein D5018_15155 [Parashewanella curva]|uniref:Uncharacterized protein n=1 Tax=Parashewanella curva TaxID=2338552 RepID=A0A3L8PVN0_9GAMM|nr:hypothetical protein [Parashewanella curva]RLV58839.1 hypothetical protein D5018_15155 [Parashewanella curva]